MKSILISGWYGHDNAGDEAILQQFIAEMVEGCEVQLRVLCERPERIDTLYGQAGVEGVDHSRLFGYDLFRSLFSGALRKQLRALRQADLFVLGGGGLLRDNTNWKNALRLIDEIWLARLFGVRTAIYAIGAGPFRSRWYKWLFRHTLQRCDWISVREPTSKRWLVDLGVPAGRITVTADPALLLEPQPLSGSPAEAELLAKVHEPGAVGLFLKHFPALAQMAEALDTLHERAGLSFVAIPLRCHYEGGDDRDAARLVRRGMRNPKALYDYNVPLSARQVKWLAGQFRFNLSVRLHGLIFSAAMGVPAVAVNYEEKVANVLRSLQIESLLVAPDADMRSRLVQAVSRCRSDLATYEQHLRRVLPRQRQLAGECFTALRAILNSARRAGEGSRVSFSDSLKLFLLGVLGRSPFYSWGRAKQAYTASLRRDDIYCRWLGQCSVVRQDPDGLVLWDTPRGPFWAPGNTPKAALSLILAEQEVKAYGEGEAGVRPGDVVLDCGANIGVFTREALAAGAERVLAIEPTPENVRCLRRNLEKEIADGRVVVCEKGLWDREDVLTLLVDPRNAGGNSFITRNEGSYRSCRVPVTTVDRLIEELHVDRVDFIKVDVEAAEQKVLAGAAKTLRRFRPRLAVAVEHTPDRLGNAKGVAAVVRRMRPDYRVDSSLCYVWERHVVLPEVLHFC